MKTYKVNYQRKDFSFAEVEIIANSKLDCAKKFLDNMPKDIGDKFLNKKYIMSMTEEKFAKEQLKEGEEE